ncbi:uncharacterized protein PV07_03072 [Cladophialophora immunda]|uniref:Uncharacterized protein n=1 Tax=Cladophialophora immunda TaxID=569365 RepID=A0A0D2B1E0_9EURO|nr:uncharacterized protein PV07_03072 [Cladophialophora immunda]KIW31422.1 hypothetical protein PV07_03072 [Cladophialophora immunda]
MTLMRKVKISHSGTSGPFSARERVTRSRFCRLTSEAAVSVLNMQTAARICIGFAVRTLTQQVGLLGLIIRATFWDTHSRHNTSRPPTNTRWQSTQHGFRPSRSSSDCTLPRPTLRRSQLVDVVA